jgi:phosphatidylinositol alpha-mannosyltransferase
MPTQSKSIKNKLRIGYLLDDTLDKPDGVQQYVLAIGEYFRSLGNDVHYLVAETHRKDIQNVHSLGKFISVKFNGNAVRTPLPASTKEIKKLLSDLDLDVLHVQLGYSPFFGAKVIKNVSSDCRIVGTWHTFPSGKIHYLANWVLGIFIKRTLKRFSATVGVSKSTADFARKVFGTHSGVIPNAVPLDKFNIVPAKHTKKRMVFLGRFVQRKGPVHLLYALARVRELRIGLDDYEVVMAGRGPELSKSIRLAKNLGLSGIITFPGFINEDAKPALLASADITVFPSTGGEAFGISIVEAMASGASVVLGGNNAGYASILGKKPELLFNPKNIEQFALKLAHFMTINDRQSKELKSWLMTESKQYDTPVICKNLLEMYQVNYTQEYRL